MGLLHNTLQTHADSSALGMEDESSAMEDFMASSPPAWNAEIPRPQSTRNVPTPDVEEENDWDEEDPEIQDIPNAHFDVLQVIDAEGEPHLIKCLVSLC